MKQVTGSLRLDLAQYREMETFAQFGTELDQATVKQLERGKRLVEILKQPQYKPMKMEEEIVIIFAGVNGYLDDVDVKDISRFENEFLEYMSKEKKDLMDKIKHDKSISESLDKNLRNAITQFKKKFIKM